MKSLLIVAVALYTTTHSPKAPPALVARVRMAEAAKRGPSAEYKDQLAREAARQKARRAAKGASYNARMRAESKAASDADAAKAIRQMGPLEYQRYREAMDSRKKP